jgi:hypothetical protein
MRNEIVGAIYSFAGWLTTRETKLVCSEKHNASPMAEAVKEFLDLHGITYDSDEIVYLTSKNLKESV